MAKDKRSAAENLMLAPVKLLKKDRQEAYDRAMELLASVGLADKALNYPGELSGGQQQRVAIMRALAMDPKVLLFDEPTSALDPTMVGEVLAVIRGLARRGMIMLIVTHEMNFARNISDRVFYMDEGTIYEEGTPEQIFEAPVREKTRQFIKKLRVFTRHIPLSGLDYMGIIGELHDFAWRHMIPPVLCRRMEALYEEICVQTVLLGQRPPEGVDISFSYSEITETADLLITWNRKENGPAPDPLESADSVSLSIAKAMAQELAYSCTDSACRITAVIKNVNG